MKNFNDLVQPSLALLMEVPRPRFLPEPFIEACADYGDAIRLCMSERMRRLSEAEIAAFLGFRPAHLSKVKHGLGYLTSDQELILQRLCSNWAIRQYSEMRHTQLSEMIETPAEKMVRMQQKIDAYERERRAA